MKWEMPKARMMKKLHRKFRPGRVAQTCCALLLALCSMQVPAAGAAKLLAESADPHLQKSLEKIIREKGLEAAVQREELALVLVTLANPESPRMAELNGRKVVYAGSLPKIASILGAAVSLDDGSLTMDQSLQEDLTNMIRFSCNACATRVLERVGRDDLLDILQSPEMGFYDQETTGGLWVGKDYGPSAAYKRDPLAGLSHGATAFQAARFYYKLYTGTLVSPEQSSMMMEVLSRPGISHKFVKGLEKYPDLKIYRKSGTWKTYHADSALVVAADHAYIMIGLAHSANGSKWLEQLAGPIHELAVSERVLTVP